MDRGAWQVTVNGITRVGHNLVLSFLGKKYVYSWLSFVLMSIHKTMVVTTAGKQNGVRTRKFNASFYINSVHMRGFPGGLSVKNPPANANDVGSVLGSGRSSSPPGRRTW